MSFWRCDPPGDVEERKADAVFDEDGEVVHVQHRLSGKDNGRESRAAPFHVIPCALTAVRVLFCSFVCVFVCAQVVHFAFLLGRAPSSDLTPTLGFVRGGLEANSCYCPCVGKWTGLISKWYKQNHFCQAAAGLSLKFLYALSVSERGLGTQMTSSMTLFISISAQLQAII